MSRALLNRDPDEVAAELFLRRRSGDWSEADARELAAWLEAAPLHRECFEGVERMWGAAGEGAGSPAVLIQLVFVAAIVVVVKLMARRRRIEAAGPRQ